MNIPGRRSITVEEEAGVREKRDERKKACYIEFLNQVEMVRWCTCENCMEKKLDLADYSVRSRRDPAIWCKRCKAISRAKPWQFWTSENKAHPGDVPPCLQILTDVEAMLIARICPVFKVQVLKGGGLKMVGNSIAFCQDQSSLFTNLPRLPCELEYMFIRRACDKRSTHQKEFTVRRNAVYEALKWLKENNEFFFDIEIDFSRLNQLPEDGSVEEEMVNANCVQLAADEVGEVSDLGPAPSQLPPRQDSGEDLHDLDIEHGAVMNGSAPGDAEENLFAALREAVDPSHASEAAARQVRYDTSEHNRATAAAMETSIPGSSAANRIHFFFADQEKVNENTMGYWSMAFPLLFPTATGDFNLSREFEIRDLGDWAEYCLWWHDGRFARHPYFKFVVMNIIQRRQAAKQSAFFVGQRLGEAAPSLGELKDRIANKDTSILRSCIAYAANIAGSDPYWYARKRELQAMVKFLAWQKKGLPSFFLTGSCAEFHWKPLIDLLSQHLQSIGDDSDIVNDLKARRRVVKQYSNVVCQFFHFKTEAFIKKVLMPVQVYGVSDYYLRFEYAASRGQIHFHMLAWRSDRTPHGILQGGVTGEGYSRQKWETDVGKWCGDMGFTAEHPGGEDKDLWAAPEGTDVSSEGRSRCLEEDFKDKMDSTEHLCNVYNKVMLHNCTSYCLKKQGRGVSVCYICRSGFGNKDEMKEFEGDNGPVLIEKKEFKTVIWNYTRSERVFSWRDAKDSS